MKRNLNFLKNPAFWEGFSSVLNLFPCSLSTKEAARTSLEDDFKKDMLALQSDWNTVYQDLNNSFEELRRNY